MASRTVSIRITGDAAQARAAMASLAAEAEASGLKVQGSFSKSGQAAENLGKKTEEAGKKSKTSFADMASNLATLGGGFGKVGDEGGRALDGVHSKTSALGGVFQSLAGSMGNWQVAAGAAVAVVLAGSIKLGLSYDQQESQLASLGDMSKKQADAIGNAFLSTAGKSTFSGAQMMSAFTPVAGQLQQIQGHAVTASESLQFMSSATNLAEASHQDLNMTTKTLADTMQVFGLDTTQAGHATDVLFNASRSAGVGFDQLDQVTARFHGKLGGMNPTLQELGGLLVDVSNTSVRGSRGLMAVQSGLGNLMSGGKQVNPVLYELGVHMNDASGHAQSMRGVMDQLIPALDKLPDAQRREAEQALFGKTAWETLDPTIRAGVQAYDQATTAVGKTGSAHEGAEKATNNLASSWEKLKAGGEDLGTKLGVTILPAVKDLSKAAVFLVQHFDQVKLAIRIVVDITTGGLLELYNLVLHHTKAIGQAFVDAYEWVKNVSLDIWHFLDTIWHGIDAGVRVVWSGIRLYFETWWDAVKTLFFTVPMFIWHGIIEPVWHGIDSITRTIWNGLSQFFIGYWNTLKGIFQTVVNFIWHDVVEPVWHGIDAVTRNVWNGLTGFFAQVWRDIKGAVVTGVDDVIGVVNGIVHGIDAVLGFVHLPTIPDIPKLASGGTVGLEVVPQLAAGGFSRIGAGFITRQPTAIVGEGNQSHPEFVIPTDPAHRGNATRLHGMLSRHLGMASGGMVGGACCDKCATGDNCGGTKRMALGGFLGELATAGVPQAAFGLHSLNPLPAISAGARALGHVVMDIPGVRDLAGLVAQGLTFALEHVWPVLGVDRTSEVGIIPQEMNNVREAAIKFLQGLLDQKSGPSGSGPHGPAPPGACRDWITAGMGLAGVPTDAGSVGCVYSRAQQESGCNPGAINNWDSNARAGHPSKGLLQTIDGTFSAYAVPGHGDIWNPIDNTAAAVRYMMGSYHHLVCASSSGYAGGGILPPIRSYDSGGWLPEGISIAHNGTGAPERVGGGDNYDIDVNMHSGASPYEVGSELVWALRNRASRSVAMV